MNRNQNQTHQNSSPPLWRALKIILFLFILFSCVVIIINLFNQSNSNLIIDTKKTKQQIEPYFRMDESKGFNWSLLIIFVVGCITMGFIIKYIILPFWKLHKEKENKEKENRLLVKDIRDQYDLLYFDILEYFNRIKIEDKQSEKYNTKINEFKKKMRELGDEVKKKDLWVGYQDSAESIITNFSPGGDLWKTEGKGIKIRDRL